MSDGAKPSGPRGARDPAAIRAIGERLRRSRRSANLSMDALARDLGVSFQQFRKYEIGFNRIPVDLLARCTQILNIDAAWLLGLPSATPIIETYPSATPIAAHIVEVVLKHREFEKVYRVGVVEMALGFDLFAAALWRVRQEILEETPDDEPFGITLVSPDGRTVRRDAGTGNRRTWIERMVVSIRIVGVQARSACHAGGAVLQDATA